MRRNDSGLFKRALLVLTLVALLPAVAMANGFTGSTPLERLIEVGDWYKTVQIGNPVDPEYGGIRTDEQAPDTYQCDAGKAMVVWSTLKRLLGTNAYDSNLNLLWTYNVNLPVQGRNNWYQYEYDSGWVAKGELEYRRTTGDTTYVDLAREHCDWALANQLTLNKRNVITDAFVASAIYEWAKDQGDDTMKQAAVDLGDYARVEIENDPTILEARSLEIHGALAMMGVLGSYFEENIPARKTWVQTYAPFLPTSVPSGSHQWAHQGYLVGGNGAVWEALADPSYKNQEIALIPALVAEDDDDDGGIPKNENAIHDEAWATGNLALHGFDAFRQQIDISAAQDNFAFTTPGELVFDFAAANHLSSTTPYWMVAFLTVPSGGVLFLAVFQLVLPGDFALGLQDIPLRFPAGSLPGDYEFKIQAYSPTVELQDEVILKFTIL